MVGLPTGAHFLESEKCGNCDKLATGKKQCVNIYVANVIIGVDMKFEKKVSLEMYRYISNPYL